ncbi:hypothetical protein [Sphingomonas faeni]
MARRDGVIPGFAKKPGKIAGNLIVGIDPAVRHGDVEGQNGLGARP